MSLYHHQSVYLVAYLADHTDTIDKAVRVDKVIYHSHSMHLNIQLVALSDYRGSRVDPVVQISDWHELVYLVHMHVSRKILSL
jgi:hypothetical protein